MRKSYGIEHWISKLDAPHGRRRLAMERLIEFGEPAIEPLISALEVESAFVRRSAAQLLGRIGDSRAVLPLIRALNDNRQTVRTAVAWALGALGDLRAVEPLKAAELSEQGWSSSPSSWALNLLSPQAEPETVVTDEWQAPIGIIGSELLTNVFGYWPSFHDGEVLDFLLTHPDSVPSFGADIACCIHVFEVNCRRRLEGQSPLRKHTLVRIRFCDIRNLEVEGFGHQNTLQELKLEVCHDKIGGSSLYEIEFVPSNGMWASFKCRRVVVQSAEPYQPIET